MRVTRFCIEAATINDIADTSTFISTFANMKGDAAALRNTADAAALETLTELTQSFIGELGRSARSYCELACRVEPVSADILLSLVEMGVPVSGLHSFATRAQRVTIPAPSQLTTPKQTSILHTGVFLVLFNL